MRCQGQQTHNWNGIFRAGLGKECLHEDRLEAVFSCRYLLTGTGATL
jgi:hypothetical protein